MGLKWLRKSPSITVVRDAFLVRLTEYIFSEVMHDVHFVEAIFKSIVGYKRDVC